MSDTVKSLTNGVQFNFFVRHKQYERNDMLQKQINADITTELFIFNSVVPLRDVK